MRIAVIIAEYNPFHNGHAYHIAQTRKNGATHIAVVMSGNFVQRGEPAFLEKHVRARAALSGGADLVLELPLAFACAPAQRFGLGAVYVAEKMGCVDMLSFGSESGDTARLEQAAAVLDTPQFREALARELESGAPYPQAVSRAMERCGSGFAGLTASPNDTLALEYLRALRQLGSKIRPMAVRRAFVEHDAEEAADGFASASRLRALAQPEKIAAYVPEEAAQLYRAELESGHTPDPQRLDAAVLGVLRPAAKSGVLPAARSLRGDREPLLERHAQRQQHGGDPHLGKDKTLSPCPLAPYDDACLPGHYKGDGRETAGLSPGAGRQ